MSTTTPKLGLPRPVASDNVTLANQQALIDAIDSGAAPVASPALSGVPTSPTAIAGTSTAQIATTAFVATAVASIDTSRLAPKSSPAFTGDPTAPTPAVDDNDTSIATTAFVIGQASNVPPLMDGTATIGASKKYSREDHKHPTDTTRLAAASYTASDVLSKLTTVDGLGSGLDADIVRGVNIFQQNQTTHTNAIGLTEAVRWKNFGNGHVIFDASAGTSPNNTSINNTNSSVPWQATYPSLMGWNGSQTYGIRVDSARSADYVNGVQLRDNAGVLEYFSGGSWLSMGGAIIGASDITVQHSFATEYINIPSNYNNGLLVAKFIPKGIGDAVISADMKAFAPTYTNVIYLSVFQENSYDNNGNPMPQFRFTTTPGPNWRLPIGTMLGGTNTGPTTPLLATGSSGSNYINVSGVLRIHSRDPIYLVSYWSGEGGGGLTLGLKNIQVKYDIIG
ncbi:hypothetical protein GCM10008018_06800 [Paenibacillus marchantiophytorum]|uniref:Tail fiber protein n=1 Tax=Paenibacillus marchantiophytorum TaxID=1619310 RepID=A0ABQ2BPD4_9BACL|nr:hypothetical protein [Paenibacillus marchantiophytorum]GGI44377.1 hypothetical protein GCM10008018_06800 [Paenibacillus marchantiophytorum]